jgi:hypothetical protein
MRLAGKASDKTSLFAQSVQANVSPTYAFPKAGGRVRSGERTKVSLDAAGDLDG